MLTDGPGPAAELVPAGLVEAAAARLVPGAGLEQRAAAKRLISAAPGYGIDVRSMWVVRGASASVPVRQAALPVLGAGRTVMMFLSRPGPERRFGAASVQRDELAACVSAACRHQKEVMGDGVALAQALPDRDEVWAAEALTRAGWRSVGNLLYLRMAVDAQNEDGRDGGWPSDIEVRPLRGLTAETDLGLMMRALERSYEETMDCPELCGLRDIGDVLASHKATGVFDPGRWWLVLHEGEAAGCVLLNENPELGALELVYCGLAKAVRGRGLGARVLEHAIRRSATGRTREVTCAVDTRNGPAIAMYRRLGFERFAEKMAFVMPLDG